MGPETVTLIVGKKRKEYVVHKKLLCDSCKYFKDAFDGRIKEGNLGTMYMPEDDADVVAMFIEWLYKSHFPLMIKDSGIEKSGEIVEITSYPEDKVETNDTVFGPITKAEHDRKLSMQKKEEQVKYKARQERLRPLYDRYVTSLFLRFVILTESCQPFPSLFLCRDEIHQ